MKDPSLATLRVDQVGSLLRPSELLDAFAQHGRGEIGDADLRAAEDAAIRRVVARQESVGLGVVTDGEYRRLNFQDSFGASVAGYASGAANTLQYHEERSAGGAPLQRWESGTPEAGPAILHRRPVEERLRLARNLPLEEYQFTRTIASKLVKVTLVGPDRVSQRVDYQDCRSRAVYAGLDAFVADVIAVQRRMVSQLVAEGCRYVQLDEPGYTAYVDPPSLQTMRDRGENPAENVTRSIAADNAVIADFPGVTFAVHLCRGNQRSMWHREGSYDAIAEQLFTGLNFQRLLLEYDSDRAGGFEPLRFVPAGKIVVLGLVSSKVPEVESADYLKRRIDEASRYLPLEQLAVSPQCGFASDVVGNLLSEEAQWRKFEVLRQVAQDVRG